MSEQLDYEPASLFVVVHRRCKYACPRCQEHVAVAPKPAPPIARGLPGPGLCAQVIVSKYADHLPLHRQERIFERHGLTLDRSTMCGWVAACALLLAPLYPLMQTRVRQSRVLHSDDTGLPVLDNDRDRTRLGYLWTYIGDRAHPYTVFDFTATHSRAGPAAFLAGFHGYLQADAHAVYDRLFAADGPFEVACWAHARRNVYEARGTDAARSAEALARLRQRYGVEHAATEAIAPLPALADGAEAWARAAAVRRRFRQEQAVPLLTSFGQWLEQEQRAVLPKSPTGQAISYALKNWQALMRYSEHGFLAIDNNVAERALRQCVLGRNNYLFAGSDNGGQTAAILYSVTATCRRHGIDPFAYLRDVLARLPEHAPESLGALLPEQWQAGRATPGS